MLVKEFLEQNIGDNVEPYKLINHIVPMQKWYHEILKRDGQASFANLAKRRPIANEPQGYITLKSFFDPTNEGGFYDSQPEEWMNDLNCFMQEYGNWKIDEDSIVYDNTYNAQGNIEDNIDYQMITIANPNGIAYESRDLLLMRCSVSLDPRGYYTDYCMAIFDNSTNTTDLHYQATAFLNRNFTVMNGVLTVKQNNNYKHYDLEITASALNCEMTVEFYPEDDDANSEVTIYTCDDLSDVLAELSEQLDIPINKLSLHDVEYLSESEE